MTKTLTRESGFTLLELLLVIGVAALLLIGGIATYRLVSDGNKATETTRMLLTLRQETQTMAQQQGGNYTGIAFDSGTSNPNSPLVTSNVLTDNKRNPFNGNITIEPTADAAGTTDANLLVTMTNISQAGCGKLAVAIDNPNEVVSVNINGAGARTPPLTVANTAADCTTGTNTIVWQFP